MKKFLLSFLLIFVYVFGSFGFLSNHLTTKANTLSLSDLPVGTLISDPNTTYLGVPIVWRIAAHNHAGYPEGSTTLISDKILTSHMVDGKEPINSDSNRKSGGNNRWAHSNLRQWLNKSGSPWWESQHATDTQPVNANGTKNAFGYAEEAGFLSNFSDDFINNLFDTSYSVVLSSVDGGGTETLQDKIFLASVKEVNLGTGGAFPIFTDNASRIAYYTEEGVAYHNAEAVKVAVSTLTTDTANYWWLRDAYGALSHYVRNIDTAGTGSGFYSANFSSNGVRPLCNLQSSVFVSSLPNENGVYSIQFS